MSATLSPYLLAEDVAARLGLSVGTVREYARSGTIPHLKRSGSRRLLFRADELEAWEHGADLILEELPRGGRRVRPL